MLTTARIVERAGVIPHGTFLKPQHCRFYVLRYATYQS